MAVARHYDYFQDGIWDVTEIQLLDYTRPDAPGVNFTNEYIATCTDGRRTINLICGTSQTLFVGDSFHFAETRSDPNAIEVGGEYVVLLTR